MKLTEILVLVNSLLLADFEAFGVLDGQVIFVRAVRHGEGYGKDGARCSIGGVWEMRARGEGRGRGQAEGSTESGKG